MVAVKGGRITMFCVWRRPERGRPANAENISLGRGEHNICPNLPLQTVLRPFSEAKGYQHAEALQIAPYSALGSPKLTFVYAVADIFQRGSLSDNSACCEQWNK